MHKPGAKANRFLAALDTGAHILQTGAKIAGTAKTIYDVGKYVAPFIAAL